MQVSQTPQKASHARLERVTSLQGTPMHLNIVNRNTNNTATPSAFLLAQQYQEEQTGVAAMTRKSTLNGIQ